MKKLLLNATILCLLIAISSISTFAQLSDKSSRRNAKTVIAIQKSPFDFADKHYLENGVNSEYILNRKNGADKMSVFDYTYDARYQNVRVTATQPAYDQNGELVFFNHFGDVPSFGFTNDTKGEILIDSSDRMPIYIFPSTQNPGMDRQAPIIVNNSKYADSNQLSVRAVCEVEFTPNSGNDDDNAAFIREMIEKHGASLDGSPIIRSVDNLMVLLSRGMISIKKRGLYDVSIPSYMIAPVIQDPTGGAIAQDAYLRMVLNFDGKPLPFEELFEGTFNCLKSSGNFCPAK